MVACIHNLFSLWERCWEFCWRAPHEEIIDGAVAKSQCKTAPGAWLICMWLDIALSLLQDYPSLAQLHEKLRDSNILPIFAVTELVSDLYQVAILLFILFSFIFYLYFKNLLCCVMFICLECCAFDDLQFETLTILLLNIILTNKWFTVIQKTCFFK